MPQYGVSETDGTVILRNYEGVITSYHEPDDTSTDVDDSIYREKYQYTGVASLFGSGKISMEPADLDRSKRVREWKEHHKNEQH